MATKVKICGIKTAEVLSAAIAAGADFVGLNFFPASPRYVPPAGAAALARQVRGRLASVALVVDADDTLLTAIMREVQPDLLQLHGRETPARAREIGQLTGCPLIKAISVESRADAERARHFRPFCALILFDAKPPPGGPLPGGNGVAFDWHHLETVKNDHPFMLSGGLTPANVAAAIQLTGADVVDVSSGVEIEPGRKSPDLIRDFVRAAKGGGAGPTP